MSVSGPKIAVLDYGIGNLRSAEKALQHVGAATRLVTDPAEVEAADAVVLPGVGAFGACAPGPPRERVWRRWPTPPWPATCLLAVCIGFQLLYEGSDENTEGGTSGGGGANADESPGSRRERGSRRARPSTRAGSGSFPGE